MMVNYLLMQERVTEAVDLFRGIQPVQPKSEYGEAQLQEDYIRAYLDFYECGKTGSLEFREARAIVGKYLSYPVLHWRKLFREIDEQLKEIDAAYMAPKEGREEVKLDNFEDDEGERKRKTVKMEP